MLETHKSSELFVCNGCAYLVIKDWAAAKDVLSDGILQSPKAKYGKRVDRYCVKCVNKYDR